MWRSPSPVTYASFVMKKNSHFTEHFNHIINGLKATGNLDILMMKYPISGPTNYNKSSTYTVSIGFEKLTFLFVILFIGIILSLIGIIFEFKFKPMKKQEKYEPSSKEMDEFENKTKALLEGPLKEKAMKSLKKLLDGY